MMCACIKSMRACMKKMCTCMKMMCACMKKMCACIKMMCVCIKMMRACMKMLQLPPKPNPQSKIHNHHSSSSRSIIFSNAPTRLFSVNVIYNEKCRHTRQIRRLIYIKSKKVSHRAHRGTEPHTVRFFCGPGKRRS